MRSTVISLEKEWQNDRTPMRGGIHERKWEIDSLCYVVRLVYHYWKVTGGWQRFTANGCRWLNLSWQFSKTSNEENRGNYSFYVWRTGSMTRYPTMDMEIRSVPTDWLPLLSPSDDATVYPFLIPSNFLLWPAASSDGGDPIEGEQKQSNGSCGAMLYMEGRSVEKHAAISTYGRFMLLKWTDTAISSAWMMPNIPVCWLCLHICDVKPRIDLSEYAKISVESGQSVFFKGKYAEGIGKSNT